MVICTLLKPLLIFFTKGILMTKYYAVDHEMLIPYLRNHGLWPCDTEPVIHMVRNAHDEHGCAGWKIAAFCPDCEESFRYFITRHDAINNGVAKEYHRD